MAKNVRNFWVETASSDRAVPVGTGPSAADGGFTTRISIRDEGQIRPAVRIEGIADRYGELELHVIPNPGAQIEPLEHGGFRITSKR